jgi:hypothetical protein
MVNENCLLLKKKTKYMSEPNQRNESESTKTLLASPPPARHLAFSSQNPGRTVSSSVPLRPCAFSDTSTARGAEPSFSAVARTDACETSPAAETRAPRDLVSYIHGRIVDVDK